MKYEIIYRKVQALVKTTLDATGKAFVEVLKNRFRKGQEIFNSSQTLQQKTGSLLSSFKYEIKQSGIDGKVLIGSDHPASVIHEFGGFIKAKKFVSRRNRKIPVMANYFWFKYITTKKPEYKIIALSVMNKHGVNIPKRNYLSKTNKEFLSKFDEIKNSFVNEFIGYFNA